jgi:uroporphyrinogen decarboxylase
VAQRTGTTFDRMSSADSEYWKIYVDFWLGMAYDCIPLEIPLNCPLGQGQGGGVSRASESLAVIRSREEFEKYPWPPVSDPLDFKPFETVAALLPPGVKILGGVCAGPFEWVSWMMGVMGLAYALADDPGLVADMFRTVGNLHVSAVRQLAGWDAIGALRQGDDLGFKTSTFLSPEQLRKYVFPIYRQMAAEAHARGKPFILHSCGNLKEVYEDLIEYCRIDAKHSFEDVILPVQEFKKQYGRRITPLGGLDVDLLCRGSEREIRAYTRRCIEACFSDGYWALGTGNSLTNYLPVDHYIWALEEGIACTS